MARSPSEVKERALLKVVPLSRRLVEMTRQGRNRKERLCLLELVRKLHVQQQTLRDCASQHGLLREEGKRRGHTCLRKKMAVSASEGEKR